jgi:hypothetical protein
VAGFCRFIQVGGSARLRREIGVRKRREEVEATGGQGGEETP